MKLVHEMSSQRAIQYAHIEEFRGVPRTLAFDLMNVANTARLASRIVHRIEHLYDMILAMLEFGT